MAATLQLPPMAAGYDFEAAPDLAEAATRKHLSTSAAKAFFRIMGQWKIRDEDARQLIGGLSSGSYYALKGHPGRALDQDILTRISLLTGIFKALHILYSPRLANAWMTLPNQNAMFRGAAPLAYILRFGQPGMMHVRQLLDARRGGQ
jgi:hypothetical protein